MLKFWIHNPTFLAAQDNDQEVYTDILKYILKLSEQKRKTWETLLFETKKDLQMFWMFKLRLADWSALD